MKIWTPNQHARKPCHDNGYLQTAADVRARRNRFRLNPWGKVGSILVPQPLRFAGGRRRCCCGGGVPVDPGEDCSECDAGETPSELHVTVSDFGNSMQSPAQCYYSDAECNELNGDYILAQQSHIIYGWCFWTYTDVTTGKFGITLTVFTDLEGTSYMSATIVEGSPSGEACQFQSMLNPNNFTLANTPCCGNASEAFTPSIVGSNGCYGTDGQVSITLNSISCA